MLCIATLCAVGGSSPSGQAILASQEIPIRPKKVQEPALVSGFRYP